jgi:GxxExxY protein
LLVADKIVVELKTDPAYQSAHEAQLLNELRGTEIHLGYLLNFGRERVEYKRMVF